MSSVEKYQVAFVVASLLTILAMPLVLSILRRNNSFDLPNERSSHSIPTPRGAGLAQILGVTGALAFTGWIPVSGLVAVAGFSALGAADDFKPRPPLIRLILQFALASVSIILAFHWSSALGLLPLLGIFVAVLVLVWTVNSINFMDGINGISVIHGIIFGLVYAVMLWRVGLTEWVTLGAAIAGVSLAVMPWNWGRKAKVFLGDSGSYLLGAAVGVLLLVTWFEGPGFLIALAPMTIYIADTASTLISRLWRRESLTQAHKNHAYQRLVQNAWSHPKTALFVGGLSTITSLIALGMQQGTLTLQLGSTLLFIAAGLYLVSPRLTVRQTQ